MAEQANEQEYFRRKHLDELAAAGIDPYPTKFEQTHRCLDFIKEFDELAPGENNASSVRLSGRIMAIRGAGRLMFMDLHDEQGKVQLMISKGAVGDDAFSRLGALDVGDLIGVAGQPLRSKRGELSIAVMHWELLAKCLLPLPEKWHGLRDTEIRYRQRYLDLLMNPEVRKLFRLRSTFIREMRRFMESYDFMEVETPVLELIPGGADAQPFATHHNALDLDMYLRISLELHLKRLLVGGFERVYEIGKVFRNEGMSTEHLQEFTLMECYWAYIDYHRLMTFIEEMYCTLIERTIGSLKVTFRGQVLDFTPPWPRHDYRELILAHTGLDLDAYPDVESMAAALPHYGIEPDQHLGRGRLIDQLFKKASRPQLMQPCFLMDHPVDISPLAKRQPKRPTYVQRFQVVFGGSEVGNAFGELNDPVDQAGRFRQQAALREKGDQEAQRFDADFLRALHYGMPPAAGFGVGIDRFIYILTDAGSIRETVFFPTMRPLGEEAE
ncbi:lysine--tRNA ligase [bacterium]|nr:lysine--tRNA ligase [candidate division CSSED10-310 bacterium]